MIKEYRSRTAISVNAVLPSRKCIHVAFAAQSDGSSVYVTGNADIQYALEHHYRYGKLFRLAEWRDEDGVAGSDGAEASPGEPDGQLRKVKVSDIAAAKDFLADTFGISRTSLRSEKAILEAGRGHGVEFEF